MSSDPKFASPRQLLQLGGMFTQNLPENLSSDTAQEWMDEPVELRKSFEEWLRKGIYDLSQVKTREIEVTIDPSRSVKQWIEVRKGHFNDADITPSTVGKFLTVRRDATEPYKATVVAFNFGFSANLRKVLRLRNRLGLKPVGFEHEAALAEQHPEIVTKLVKIVNPDVIIEWHMDTSGSSYHSYLMSSRSLGSPGNAEFGWYASTWYLGLK